MDTKFDFILTKTQRDAFIANWKQLHAARHTFTGLDYFIFQLLKSAQPDIEKNMRRAFKPAHNSYFAATIKAVTTNLIHNLTYNRARFFQAPIFANIEFTDQQVETIIGHNRQLCNAI